MPSHWRDGSTRGSQSGDVSWGKEQRCSTAYRCSPSSQPCCRLPTLETSANRLSQATDPVGRISRNDYDTAGQLLKVIRAYGTPLQQDYARYSYTANGQRASLPDTNDNRSVHVYDQYDRLCRLYFPVATLGANAANTGGIVESALVLNQRIDAAGEEERS